MRPEAKQHIADQLAYLKANKDNLTIDADTHISDIANLEAQLRQQYLEAENYYHGKPISAEDLLAEMEMAGGRRRTSYSAVTISVFPEEAELLAFAMNVNGTLTLSLRNPNDVSVLEQTPPIDFQALQRELPRLNEKRQSILRSETERQPMSR